MTMTDDTFLDDDEEFESAADNPDAAVAAAAAALEDKHTPPTLQDPLDGPVQLTAGFRRVEIVNGETRAEVVREAWVRELNGEDEERIAKTKLRDSGTYFLNSILEAGIEKLGDKVPTKEDIEALAMGDRDYLLLQIARATYGNDLDYEDMPCPHCGKPVSFTVHLDEDVPVKRLASPDEASFEIRLSRDRVAAARLPTVEVAGALQEAETPAEANTIIIAHCVSQIRGSGKTVTIEGDEEAARRLGIKDRQALVAAISERMPGPQYNEVRFKHSSRDGCGEEIRLTITLADLFPEL